MKTIFNAGSIEAAYDTFGGELVSYKKNGREYVWQGDPAYWSGHAPVLFPVVCALRDGKTRFAGKEYTIPKHGLIRKREFELVSCDGGVVVMRLRSDDETKAKYPYDFTFTVTHTVNDSGFTTVYKVKNDSDSDMPFMLGGHAGFAISSVSNVTLTFEKDDSSELYLTTDGDGYMDRNLHSDKRIEGGKLTFVPSDFDHDVIVAPALKSRRVNLTDSADGRSFDFDFSGFDVLGIWTPPAKNAPFLCLESWNGAPAYVDESVDFEDKPWIRTIAPGGEYEVGYGMTVKA